MKKIGALLLGLLILVGCNSQKNIETKETLVIGLMPAMDSVPILWADAQGMFKDAGLDVEIIVYTNGNDRDTQVQTKAVDLVVSDIMGLVAMREANYDVVGVSQTQTMFSVVAQKGAMDKETIKVGMAEVSVTQYAADYGLTDYDVTKEFISALPQRLEMVSQNLLDGAIIPEPMASLSTLKGLDSFPLTIDSPNVLMFQKESLETKKNEVKVFYEVYNKAVDSIANDVESVKPVIIEKLGLDKDIQSVMRFPEYTHAQAISETVYQNVTHWMENTLHMKTDVKFSDAVVSDILND